MTEKEDSEMMRKNTSETLESPSDFANLCLLVLHVVVLVISLWIHPVKTAPADRTLPYADMAIQIV
jgi:hypothetical protein